MNVYIDESGSINNHCERTDYFVIAMIKVNNPKKLRRVVKRFIANNMDRLRELDKDKLDKNGKVVRTGGKMFKNGQFSELKGAQFDREMKQKFIEYISANKLFEVYYIKIYNKRLTDRFCENTARVFNYTLRLAIQYYLSKGIWEDEEYNLMLDERNEKTDTRYFLENYLNTELIFDGTTENKFNVEYFDSANNQLIQVADIFANLFYSHLKNDSYGAEIELLKEKGILRNIYEFPIK